jgi:hypothetical protein
MNSNAGKYVSPKITVYTLKSQQCLLVASNEGLGYEDLFSMPVQNYPVNDLIINEEPF